MTFDHDKDYVKMGTSLTPDVKEALMKYVKSSWMKQNVAIRILVEEFLNANGVPSYIKFVEGRDDFDGEE